MPSRGDLTGQDFTPVIIRRPQSRDSTTARPPCANTRGLEEEESPPTKISVAQTRSLQAHRIAAGYKSQRDLARATNGKIAPGRIAELENGRGVVPTGAEKQMLFRLLKIKFP